MLVRLSSLDILNITPGSQVLYIFLFLLSPGSKVIVSPSMSELNILFLCEFSFHLVWTATIMVGSRLLSLTPDGTQVGLVAQVTYLAILLLWSVRFSVRFGIETFPSSRPNVLCESVLL